jgi:flagellar biosynthesis regulator FlaF
MKAEYCVDYLSHQWNCDDLISTFRETRKQRQKYVVNNTICVLTKNEKRLKKSEQHKSIRFENALWRSMARQCTDKLGHSNQLVDPSTVSW